MKRSGRRQERRCSPIQLNHKSETNHMVLSKSEGKTFYSLSEAAAELGMGERTLQRLALMDTDTAVKISGKWLLPSNTVVIVATRPPVVMATIPKTAMSAGEAAAEAGIKLSTFYNRLARGKVPNARKIGGIWVIDRPIDEPKSL